MFIFRVLSLSGSYYKNKSILCLILLSLIWLMWEKTILVFSYTWSPNKDPSILSEACMLASILFSVRGIRKKKKLNPFLINLIKFIILWRRVYCLDASESEKPGVSIKRVFPARGSAWNGATCHSTSLV